MSSTKTKASKPDRLGKLREFAAGQPVDEVAAERYVDSQPDIDGVLRLCASSDVKQAKTGRLRAAAIVAAVDAKKGEK